MKSQNSQSRRRGLKPGRLDCKTGSWFRMRVQRLVLNSGRKNILIQFFF
jgi:hypothetical protein